MNNNYYTKFINFFIKHGLYNEEMFEYIQSKTEKFSYYNEELMNIRGIYYTFNETNQLIDIKLYIPYIENEKTLFMNIRPYIQAMHAYTKLGKKYKNDAQNEMLAMYYEKLYLKENPNTELEIYINKIYTNIKQQNTEKKYKDALNAQDELEKYYEEKNPTFNELQKKAKKLTRKYRSK